MVASVFSLHLIEDLVVGHLHWFLMVASVFSLHLIEDLVVGHFALIIDNIKCLLLAPY
jgi:hypothetical protein